jgi:hypothetical protein
MVRACLEFSNVGRDGTRERNDNAMSARTPARGNAHAGISR